MPLLDLSVVTQCFSTLLSNRIPTFPDWPAGQTMDVSAGPPDAVKSGLSFYLYHVREDAHTKAQDWQVSDGNPQRFKPMGLTLYYMMTPRSNLGIEHDKALADQLVMGLALKTMRDQPVIDDTTFVDSITGPKQVMPATMLGLGNRFRATLQPTPANQAGEYWQAGTSLPRLAAYYEVAATLLEPEVPKTRSGRVLMYGVHSFVRGQPRIDSISNRIEFTLPGESELRRLEISPAQVAYGQILEIRGAELNGDTTALLLTHRDFAEPVKADDLWSLASDGGLLTVTVRAVTAIPGPPPGSQALLPGIYGAIVRTTARRTLPDGSQRDFDSFSNQVSFAIVPAILSVTGGAVREVKVDGFEPHLLAESELLVFAGADRLTRVAAGPPGPGEFFTPATPAAAKLTLRFRFPATVTSGSVLPLRLIVRGAESGPFWDVAP